MNEPLLVYDGHEWTLAGVEGQGAVPWSTQVNGSWLRVPVGFKFDLASIPRPLWSLLAPFQLSIAAPLVHDFLYRYRGSPPPETVEPYRSFTRADVDRLFFQVMVDRNVSRFRRRTAWLAVRLFGWVPWPPTKTAVRRRVVAGLHTLWETAVALVISPSLWAVPLVATALSFVKSWLAPVVRQWIVTVAYEHGPRPQLRRTEDFHE